MSDFNYQTYLKNNPLLQEEVKEEKLLTESQEIDETVEENVEDVKLQSNTLTKLNAGITNFKTMAKAMINVYNQLSDKEQIDFSKNPSMKIVLDRLKDLADVKDEELEEIQEESTSSKMKVSELKAKIKETILSELTLDEAKDEVDIEDEIEVDDTEIELDSEEPPMDPTPAADAGLSSDETEIQNSLKLAYDNAVAIGDQKLADQIGNSITFFTRTHVVER